MIRAALVLMMLSGPVMAQTEALPDGYPPVMGNMSATLDGRRMAWQTYDFSVGAFDASAWVGDDDDNVTLRIMAFAPGKPDQNADRLRIVVEFGLSPTPDDTPRPALIEVLAEDDIDGRKLTSGKTPGVVVLDTFSRDGYVYGRTSGSFEALICFKRGPKSKVTSQCKPIKGRFDTAIQFDNM